MNFSIVLEMIENVAILLTFSLIYDYIWTKDEQIKTVWGRLFAGLLIGIIGILVSLIPIHLSTGAILDSRTVLLAIAGLFFGTLPTVTAMILLIAYQVILGGDSTWMAVASTMIAGFSGMIWRQYFPPRKIKMPYFNILLLGLWVHFLELGTVVFLPKGMILSSFKEFALPLILLYPIFTVLLGMLLFKRWRTWNESKQKNEEELQYRALFENAGEAIVISQHGKISFANKRMTDILKVSYDELRSKPFVEFIHPDDRNLVYKRHRNRVQNLDVPSNYSFRLLTKDERVLWMDISSVYFEWNGVPASLSFLSDVTERRQTERQLVLAKNKAEESDRLKSIFLANMSHEVRTPMNAILGFSELLSQESLGETKKYHYIQMIQTAGKQLLHVINDIVDVSKLEVNQLRLNKQNVKLYDIYKQSIEVCKNNPLFKEKKNVEFILNLPTSCSNLKVYADPYRIRQILDNLLSNAVKYTDEGSIEFGCSLVKGDNTVTINTYVKDTGIGIPEGKQDIIFKRFRQVEENHYREGAGLGLSITKGIIDLMGGDISYTSEPGIGSEFRFNLELEIAEESKVENKKKVSSIPNLKGMNIYVAEDDLTSYFLIKEFLNETQANISHASDGEVLMKMLEQQVPDLLLLDINMPKKDGYSCLEEIKEKNYKLKIIAQTAYAMENEKDHCLASGCQGYVSKPIDPEILFDEIAKIISN